MNSSTAEPEQVHADVVAATHAWLRHRADNVTSGPGQWRNPEIQARLVKIIETVWVRSHRIGEITARTDLTADGATWHYIARDALVAAADRTGLRDYRITTTDYHTYRLTWH